MTNRITNIDWLKAFAIYLVVLGHQPISCTEIHDWIFTFHVPLFFFISGYLMKLGHRKGFIWKNIRNLLLVTIPYFILSLVLGAVNDFLFYRSDLNFDHNLIIPLKNYLLGKSEAGVMWFLFALFWMRVLYYYSYLKLNNRYIILLISITASMIIVYTNCTYNYYQVIASIIAFPFFCFGALLRHSSLVNSFYSSWVWLALGFFFSVIPILLLPIVGKIDLSSLLLGNNTLLYYLVSISGSLGMFFFSKLIQKEKTAISVLSNGTLVILLLHMPLLLYFKAAYKLARGINCPPPYMDIISAILISLIIITILYYPIKWILNNNNDYIRFLAGK